MDLLRTILIYMSMVYVSSVQIAPEPSAMLPADIPTTTPYVETIVTPTPKPTPTNTPVPTINITPNPEYKTIRVGDNGDDVRNLQQKLAEYGYYAGEVDGRFGNQTRRAVENFQYNHGLGSDGIAGKNTLTVLYESDEIRKAPVEVTPTPPPTTQTDGLTAALDRSSATETPAPTFVPVEIPNTAAASDTPPPIKETTAQPGLSSTEPPVDTTPTDAEDSEFKPMKGYGIRLDGNSKLMKNTAAQTADEAQQPDLIAPYRLGEALYIPMLKILEEASVLILPSENLEIDEYAFALGNDIYRLTYTENKAGEPIDLKAFKNSQPVVLPQADVRTVSGYLYFSAQSMESLTGARFELDENAHCVVVKLLADQET